MKYENVIYDKKHKANCLYWHGTSIKNTYNLLTSTREGEAFPLAWISSSFKYARKYALLNQDSNNIMYLVRQTRELNIFNSRSDVDLEILIKKISKYDNERIREFIKNNDWMEHPQTEKKSLRKDLLEIIQSIGYDGIFNFETIKNPAVGIFSHATGFVPIIKSYYLDKINKIWINPKNPENFIEDTPN